MGQQCDAQAAQNAQLAGQLEAVTLQLESCREQLTLATVSATQAASVSEALTTSALMEREHTLMEKEQAMANKVRVPWRWIDAACPLSRHEQACVVPPPRNKRGSHVRTHSAAGARKAGGPHARRARGSLCGRGTERAAGRHQAVGDARLRAQGVPWR